MTYSIPFPPPSLAVPLSFFVHSFLLRDCLIATRRFEFRKSRGSSCNENWLQLTSDDVNTNYFNVLA